MGPLINFNYVTENALASNITLIITGRLLVSLCATIKSSSLAATGAPWRVLHCLSQDGKRIIVFIRFQA